MQLTVLGKYGPYSAAGGGTSSYLVREKTTHIALDFGSGALGRIQTHISLKDLDAILLSHLHNDHICDLFPLSYYLQQNSKTMDVYLPFAPCPQLQFLTGLEAFHCIKITDGLSVNIGELKCTFTKMEHPLESYSILCKADKTLFYSGDTRLCKQLVTAASKADLLLLDVGNAENGTAPHLSLIEAENVGKSANAKVICTHLNPLLNYTSTSADLRIAEEGETYLL